MILENKVCSLNRISVDGVGPAVIYISHDSGTSENSGNSGNSEHSDNPDHPEPSEAELIYKDVASKLNNPFVFYELKVNGWDEYLTPWPMHMGKRDFAGKAPELLSALELEIIPAVRAQMCSGECECLSGSRSGNSPFDRDEDIYIVGYSLAGLFSLYAIYESDLFAGAASCSGSLWYDGWKDYILSHDLKSGVKIYLSLGDKEKNSRNELMKTVEDNTLFQKVVFEKSDKVTDVVFEMNSGGHFSDVRDRISKGIIYILGGNKDEQD